MRNRASSLWLPSLVAAFWATPASALVTIDFDALAGNQGATFAIGAVTFSAFGGGGSIYANSTPNGTNGLLENSSTRKLLRADIAGGTDSVSIDLGDFGGDPDRLILEAYTVTNVLIGSTFLNIDAAFFGMETLSLAMAGISYVKFGSTFPSTGGSSVYADNFTYAAIPEPSTGLLLMTGLLGLAYRQRRHRRAA